MPNNTTTASWTPKLTAIGILLLFFKLLFFGAFFCVILFSPRDIQHRGNLSFNRSLMWCLMLWLIILARPPLSVRRFTNEQQETESRSASARPLATREKR